MTTKTKSSFLEINFPNSEKIKKVDGLLNFSDFYLEEIRKTKKFLLPRENKWIPLFFTRMSLDGQIENPIEYYGIPKNIKEDSFDFVNGYNISGKYDAGGDEIVNHITFNNILGVIPTLGIIKKENIFEVKNSKTAKEYLKFIEKLTKTAKSFLEKPHHLKIFFSDGYITECEVLEINKSNLLVKSLRTYKNQLQNGHYVYVNVVPHKKNIYFISRESFIQKIQLYPHKINFDPHDNETNFDPDNED